jgi:hypothetical protein
MSNGYWFKGYNDDYTSFCPTAIFTRLSAQASIQDIPTDSRIYTDDKSIRLSGVNNPFYFDAVNTYTFPGSVRGVGVSTLPVSVGQYGQFPFYVLHSEGIHALEVGQYPVVFSRMTDISREVCQYPETVSSSEVGVLFANDNGLYILQGREAKLLSDRIDEYPNQSLFANLDYKLFVNAAGPSALRDKFIDIVSIRSVDLFTTYLQGARTGYLGGKNTEVMIFNTQKPYYYIISLKTGFITKHVGWIWEVVDYYPSVLVRMREDTNLYKLPDVEDSFMVVHLETNSIDMQQLKYAVKRVVARGRFEPHQEEDDEKVFGFYMFTSPNAVNWTLSGAFQTTSLVNDIALSITGTNARYVKYVLSGRLKSGSYLNYIEHQFDLFEKDLIN